MGDRKGLSRLLLSAVFCGSAIALAGCYPAYGIVASTVTFDADAPMFERTPQMRIGSLLFPSYLWPLTVADPKDLGTHAYCPGPLPPLRLFETSRGIIYTRKAGFVDIAHIRNTIDLTYYAHKRLLAALKDERPHLVLVGAEPSVYHLWVDYPDWWKTLPPDQKDQLIEQLAGRMAQRMANLMMIWHEIITWYGYRPSLLIGEKWSAFSCDDMVSHVIGSEVGGRFLNLPVDQFEEAVSKALTQRLTELEALDPEQTRQAVKQVEGVWWDWGKQDLLRRQVDINLKGETMNPWLVPVLSEGRQAAIIKLPTLNDINGHDCSTMIRVEIVPNVLEAYAIRDDLQTSDSRIHPERDFYRLAEHIHNVETGAAQQ
jgi:hypothetical protein